jgi:PPOX class probable F420-dependent enzyme
MTVEERRGFLSEGTRTAKLATVRADGRAHVAPVWFVLDGDDLVFNTGSTTVKGRNLLRDGRVSLCVDEEAPPFAFVVLEGVASVEDGAADLLHWATRIGGRYMGEERAEEFGRRNAVPGELLVRVRPEKVIAHKNVSD